MKKVFKYIKYLILLIFINQIIILTFNKDIKNGFWKVNGTNRINDNDVLTLNSNLNWNVISENNKNVGVIQFYFGKKIVISNMNLTKWYQYEKKGVTNVK